MFSRVSQIFVKDLRCVRCHNKSCNNNVIGGWELLWNLFCRRGKWSILKFMEFCLTNTPSDRTWIWIIIKSSSLSVGLGFYFLTHISPRLLGLTLKHLMQQRCYWCKNYNLLSLCCIYIYSKASLIMISHLVWAIYIHFHYLIFTLKSEFK